MPLSYIYIIYNNITNKNHSLILTGTPVTVEILILNNYYIYVYVAGIKNFENRIG